MRNSIPNSVVHFEVSGPESEPLGAFYEQVFAWDVRPQGPGYSLVGTPEGSPNGALVEAPQGGLTLGIVVADLQASLAAAVAHGGKVVMPATDNGWVRKALVSDPAGNTLALIQG